MPPGLGLASKMVTAWPRRASSQAVLRPEGPAPTTATFLPVLSARSGSGAALPEARSWSATKRFRAQMLTASSTSLPRRQACSQGWSQIRPITPGKGSFWRIRASEAG